MGDEFAWNDRYAGDAAWTEWFKICSVSGCRPEFASRLREQISAAMYARLSRAGISREEAGDDPIAFFDAYFKLKGSREKGKPLKLYFAHRIKDEGLEMVDFVCGTLFGSGSGRVRDIVLDWIAVIKGWKPRTVADEDGRRRLVWENAGDENLAAVEQSEEPQSLDFLDEEPLRAHASRKTLPRFSSTQLRTTSRSPSPAYSPRLARGSRRPTPCGRRSLRRLSGSFAMSSLRTRLFLRVSSSLQPRRICRAAFKKNWGWKNERRVPE